jgi:hypothetical protein
MDHGLPSESASREDQALGLQTRNIATRDAIAAERAEKRVGNPPSSIPNE